MRNFYKFLPVALVSLFVLGACTVPEDSSTVVTPGQQTQTQEQAGEDMPFDPMEGRYGANLNCGMLKDANNKQNCERQLNEVIGGILESEIYSTFDVARCKELGGQMADVCESRLNETGVKGPVSAAELEMFNEIMRGERLAEPGADPFMAVTYDDKKCAELKAEGFKAYCEKMVAQRVSQQKFEQIISSGDSDRCAELEDENRIRECQMFFGMDVMPMPVIEVPEMPAEEPVAEGEGAAAEQMATLEITEADEESTDTAEEADQE